eukprot:GHRR01006276.1.p1 GENE.GHRR01006276.1~~GHRR01006276.1.p1  ORF type:complete len:490 (+),score=119.55 GHRR01006276.1:235-1704(+)
MARALTQSAKAYIQLATLAALLALTVALPDYFIGGAANSCTDHPDRRYGQHKTPANDNTITFTLKQAGSSATAVCPGLDYDVTISYGGQARRALLTTSTGTFTGSASSSCPNRAISSSAGSSLTEALSLPCQGITGSSIQLRVTSAAQLSDSFHQASLDVPITPVAQCPGSTCPGAPAAAPAASAARPTSNQTSAAPAAGTVTAASRTPIAATIPSSNRLSNGCQSSIHGYACMVPACTNNCGAMLHITTGTAQLPVNPCTSAVTVAGMVNTGNDGVTGAASQPIHLLLEVPETGYVGLSFPRTKGEMVPADAIIGWVDQATGQPQVSAYHLTDYSPTPSPTNYDGLGWASHLGVARGGSGSTLLCVTRHSQAPNANVMQELNMQALDLNWVADPGTEFEHHAMTGFVTVNAAAGSATATDLSGGTESTKAVLAHGALMLLAFIVFMPLGALVARHKWLFGNKEVRQCTVHCCSSIPGSLQAITTPERC